MSRSVAISAIERMRSSDPSSTVAATREPDFALAEVSIAGVTGWSLDAGKNTAAVSARIPARNRMTDMRLFKTAVSS